MNREPENRVDPREDMGEAGAEGQRPSDRARWTAALGYIVFLCFVSLWKSRGDPFVRFHSRQGFLLFVAECVALILIFVLDATVGRLRFIGFVVVGLLQLIAGLGALTLSVVGFVKALFGEYWELPLLGEYKDKIPDLGHHG